MGLPTLAHALSFIFLLAPGFLSLVKAPWFLLKGGSKACGSVICQLWDVMGDELTSLCLSFLTPHMGMTTVPS